MRMIVRDTKGKERAYSQDESESGWIIRFILPIILFSLLTLGQINIGKAQGYSLYTAQVTQKIKEPQKPHSMPVSTCGKDQFNRFLYSLEITAHEDAAILKIEFAVQKSGKLKTMNISMVDKTQKKLALSHTDRKKIVSGINRSCSWGPAKMNGKPIHCVVEATLFLRKSNQDLPEDEYEVEIAPPAPPITSLDSNRIFEVVETMPEFIGGIDSMYRYIYKHFSKPEEAIKNNIQGRVLISFIVNQDGSLSDIKPLLPASKHLGYGIEEALVELVKNMPNWKPGYQRNKVVKCRYTLPIKIE